MSVERLCRTCSANPASRPMLAAALALLTGAAAWSLPAVASDGPRDEVHRSKSVAVFALPDDRGEVLTEAIRGAKVSVDISIYTIGDDGILEALKRAKANGVSIRILVNGQQWISPANYPGSYKFDPVYALMCGYTPLATPAPPKFVEICPEGAPQYAGLSQAPGPGTVALHASSNNFSLTHQKTVLIDAADRSGRGLWADELPPDAKAVLLTGNLSGYGGASWPNCSSNGLWDTASCPFYSARDFGLVITDRAVIAEVERVFNSDWYCHSPCENNGLLYEPVDARAGISLLWANGITGVPGTYPVCDNGFCPPEALFPSASTGEDCSVYATGEYPYPLTGRDGSSGGTIQGNARRELLALIGGAKTSLDVYNEEMADEEVVEALAARAAAGVKVRVVMTEGNPHTYWSEGRQAWVDSFDELTAASAVVKLFPNDASHLYIHAKIVFADVFKEDGEWHVPKRSAGYLGSENISTASLNVNRELGVILSGKKHGNVLKTVAKVFDGDFRSAPITWVLGGVAQGWRWLPAGREAPEGADPCRPLLPRAESESYVPLACGPQGFPFPRPHESGFGPWNPGYGTTP